MIRILILIAALLLPGCEHNKPVKLGPVNPASQPLPYVKQCSNPETWSSWICKNEKPQ
jgi:hypothetical protein